MKRFLFASALLIAAAHAEAAQEAVHCAPHEIPIQLDFTVVAPEPAVHATATVSEIREMAGASDETGVHEAGITVAETLLSLDGTSFAVATPGSTNERKTGECIYLETVRAVFGWRTHDIYLAGHYAPGSCLYKAVLHHEYAHAAINTDVLRAFAPRIKAVLEEALTREQPVLVTKRGATEIQNATARLDESLTATLTEFQEEKAWRNAEIDTYENRMAIMRSCAAPVKKRKPRVLRYQD